MKEQKVNWLVVDKGNPKNVQSNRPKNWTPRGNTSFFMKCMLETHSNQGSHYWLGEVHIDYAIPSDTKVTTQSIEYLQISQI